MLQYPVYPYVLIASPYLHCHRCRIRKLPASSHTSSLRPQLLSTAMKTDIETAADQALVANLQDSPIPMADDPTPKPRRRKKSSFSVRSELVFIIKNFFYNLPFAYLWSFQDQPLDISSENFAKNPTSSRCSEFSILFSHSVGIIWFVVFLSQAISQKKHNTLF